jgi:DNA-binding NarL/FixJ family response regulator
MCSCWISICLGCGGSEGVKTLRKQYPSSQILMLTVYDQQDKVFESICNGACGYLPKKAPPAKLL